MITFQKYYNFGGQGAADFTVNDVADPRHPEHQEFVELLKHPCFSDKAVNMFNLSNLAV